MSTDGERRLTEDTYLVVVQVTICTAILLVATEILEKFLAHAAPEASGVPAHAHRADRAANQLSAASPTREDTALLDLWQLVLRNELGRRRLRIGVTEGERWHAVVDGDTRKPVLCPDLEREAR